MAGGFQAGPWGAEALTPEARRRMASREATGTVLLHRNNANPPNCEKSCNLNTSFLYAPHNAALHKGV